MPPARKESTTTLASQIAVFFVMAHLKNGRQSTVKNPLGWSGFDLSTVNCQLLLSLIIIIVIVLLLLPLALNDHLPFPLLVLQRPEALGNLIQMPLPLLPTLLPTLPEGILRQLHLGEGAGIELADLDAAHHGVDLEFIAAALQGSATLNRTHHEAPLFAPQTQGKIRLDLVTHRLLDDGVDGHGQVWSNKDVDISYRSFER